MLDATAALLGEIGYDGLSIGAIALRAGVGRQTIYRWWDSKSAIIGEAVVDGVIALADPLFDSEPPATPAEWLARFAGTLAQPQTVQMIRALAAAAAEDDADSEALYARLTAPAHAQLVALILASAPSASAHEAEVRADAATGALLYRVLTRRSIDEATVAELTRLVTG